MPSLPQRSSLLRWSIAPLEARSASQSYNQQQEYRPPSDHGKGISFALEDCAHSVSFEQTCKECCFAPKFTIAKSKATYAGHDNFIEELGKGGSGHTVPNAIFVLFYLDGVPINPNGYATQDLVVSAGYLNFASRLQPLAGISRPQDWKLVKDNKGNEFYEYDGPMKDVCFCVPRDGKAHSIGFEMFFQSSKLNNLPSSQGIRTIIKVCPESVCSADISLHARYHACQPSEPICSELVLDRLPLNTYLPRKGFGVVPPSHPLSATNIDRTHVDAYNCCVEIVIFDNKTINITDCIGGYKIAALNIDRGRTAPGLGEELKYNGLISAVKAPVHEIIKLIPNGVLSVDVFDKCGIRIGTYSVTVDIDKCCLKSRLGEKLR